MATQQTPRRVANFTQALLYTLVVIAILVIANFLANRYNKTYDTTSNKRYSLSDQSVKIAKNLNQNLTISYWDRPNTFERARGLLDRYKNLSPKVDVKYQDADKDPVAAKAAGVRTYGTILVQVGNKSETAKTLTEEDVTGAMVRALKGGDRMVCFTNGYGEPGTDDTSTEEGIGGAKQLIERNNYKTDTIKFLEKPEIPKDCTVLLVDGPRRDMIQPAVDALKTYVEGGGRLMLTLDPPLKFGSGVDDNDKLLAVLAGWGVKVEKNLVIDTSLAAQAYGMGAQAPLVDSYKDHVITRPLKLASMFPIVRSVAGSNAAKTTVAELFQSSDESRATANMNAREITIQSATIKGPLPLAVAGEYGSGDMKGRFVVVGTSRWIQNNVLGFAGNRDLFMNMINWLSSDEDLISIRPKDPEDRPLNMSGRQVSMVFWGAVAAMPLLIVAAGVGVWWRRR